MNHCPEIELVLKTIEPQDSCVTTSRNYGDARYQFCTEVPKELRVVETRFGSVKTWLQALGIPWAQFAGVGSKLSAAGFCGIQATAVAI